VLTMLAQKIKQSQKKTSSRAKPEKQKGKKEEGLGGRNFCSFEIKNRAFPLFSVLVSPKRSGGERKRTDLFRIFFKESSNIVQKTPRGDEKRQSRENRGKSHRLRRRIYWIKLHSGRKQNF